MLTPNSKLAVIVGIDDQDAICDVVEQIALRKHFLLKRVMRPAELLDLLTSSDGWGSEITFVLLSLSCIPNRISATGLIREVCTLRGAGTVRLIVYQKGSASKARLRNYVYQASGDTALDYIQAGACDYLVYGSYNLSKLGLRLERCFGSGLLPFYAPADLTTPNVAGASVFVITPYSDFALRDHYDGIAPALRRLNITARLNMDVRRQGFLLDSVLTDIRNHNLIIANLSEYDRKGPNPNVHLELGCALGLRKDVIQVRRTPVHRIPSDNQGLYYIEYVDSAELALALYFMLKR